MPSRNRTREVGRDRQDNQDDADCEHEFELEESKNPADRGGKGEKDNGKYGDWEGTTNKHRKGFCNKCGAWKGQLGLEPDFNLYIKHLCDIFDEVKRTLRKDGTCWVNLGDTYRGNNSRGSNGGRAGFGNEREGIFSRFESKNLCNIPSRFSIEMQNRGWILRNKIIWHKPNCMPSSVTDRFTVDFEEIFFFVKNKKYWFEQQTEELANPMRTNFQSGHRTYGINKDRNDNDLGERSKNFNFQNRNKRTVWKIPTQPFPDAHFAVFPEALVETPIKAGCPKDGIVLDPFMGSGTVALKALKENRRFVGIEINPKYIDMANERIRPLLSQSKLFEEELSCRV